VSRKKRVVCTIFRSLAAASNPWCDSRQRKGWPKTKLRSLPEDNPEGSWCIHLSYLLEHRLISCFRASPHCQASSTHQDSDELSQLWITNCWEIWCQAYWLAHIQPHPQPWWSEQQWYCHPQGCLRLWQVSRSYPLNQTQNSFLLFLSNLWIWSLINSFAFFLSYLWSLIDGHTFDQLIDGYLLNQLWLIATILLIFSLISYSIKVPIKHCLGYLASSIKGL